MEHNSSQVMCFEMSPRDVNTDGGGWGPGSQSITEQLKLAD